MENDPLLEEYFRDFHSLMSEWLRIELLKWELHKRKLKAIKLQTSCHSKRDELRLKLTADEINDAQRKLKQIEEAVLATHKINARERIGDGAWLLEAEDEVCVLFDVQERVMPNAVVAYNSDARPSIFVDIAASVKKDPRNIGHQLVLAAIERYITVLARIDEPVANSTLPSKQAAKLRLKKIYAALPESAKEKRSKSIKHSRFEQALMPLVDKTYDENYFNSVWHILEEPQSKSFKRRGLVSNWLSRIRIRLNQEYPDVDHAKTLNFLERCSVLPKKGGGKALRNAFSAFEQQLSIGSYKSYKSRMLNLLSPLSSVSEGDFQFSEKEVKQIKEDWMRKYLGMGAIDNDIDLTSSTLTWELWGKENKKLSSEKATGGDE